MPPSEGKTSSCLRHPPLATLHIFTDESRFKMHYPDGRAQAYRWQGERHIDVCVQGTESKVSASVIVWAGFLFLYLFFSLSDCLSLSIPSAFPFSLPPTLSLLISPGLSPSFSFRLTLSSSHSPCITLFSPLSLTPSHSVSLFPFLSIHLPSTPPSALCLYLPTRLSLSLLPTTAYLPSYLYLLFPYHSFGLCSPLPSPPLSLHLDLSPSIPVLFYSLTPPYLFDLLPVHPHYFFPYFPCSLYLHPPISTLPLSFSLLTDHPFLSLPSLHLSPPFSSYPILHLTPLFFPLVPSLSIVPLTALCFFSVSSFSLPFS